MEDDKQAPQEGAKPSASEGPSVTQTVSNLLGSTVSAITESVKDAALSLTEIAKQPPAVSNRIETAVPPVEENFNAPPMTADEIAEHAAADAQPVAAKRRATRRKAAPKGIAKKGKKKLTTKNAGKKRKRSLKSTSKKASKKSKASKKNSRSRR